MRLAGTCSRYSNSAMPQLTSAATYHGRSARFWRWAYQANVMKTLEQTSSSAARADDVGPNRILPGRSSAVHGAAGARPTGMSGNRRDVGLGGAEVDDAGAEQEAAVEHGVGDEHLAADLEPREQRLVERVEVVLRSPPAPRGPAARSGRWRC